MGLEQLDIITIFTEIFRIGFLVVGLFLFIKFLKSYILTRRKQKKEYIFLGISWLLFAVAYLGGTLSFFSIILFDVPYDNLLVFTILNVNIAPIITFCWFYTVIEIIFLKRKYKNLLICIIIVSCVVFELIVIFFELTGQLQVLGSMQSSFEYEYSPILKIIVFIYLIITLGAGIFLSREWMKSEDPKITIKGKFLLIAFILLCTSAILDAVVSVIDPIYAMIAKILLIACGIVFYLGYFLPNWFEKIILK